MKKTLLLDGHSILFRAFYGVPPLTDSKGRPTNAVYGFLNILFKVLEEEKPDRIGAAFDLSRQQLRRTQLYANYKGNRKPMPEELKLQEGMLLDVLEAMGIPVWRIEGCEADDILGSMAKRMAAEGGDVSIVSGDRDLLQLCDEHITIVQPRTAKGRTETRRFGPDEVKEEFGVTPAEIIDLKALMGDASDNIPGLPGVGEKTAAAIIGAYHSIENALAHVEEVRPPRAQKAFLEHFDLAELSKKLATIDTDVPFPEGSAPADAAGIYTPAALELIRSYEFKSLAGRFAEKLAMAPAGAAAAPADAELPPVKEVSDPFMASVVYKDAQREKLVGFHLFRLGGPADPCGPGAPAEADEKKPAAAQAEQPAAAPEEKLAAALCLAEGRLYLICSGPAYPAGKLRADLEQFFAACIAAGNRLATAGLKEQLKIVKIGRNDCIRDLSLLAYVLNPTKSSYGCDDIARDFLGLQIPPAEELLGKKHPLAALQEADSRDTALRCLGNEACVPYMAVRPAEKALKEADDTRLYEEIEMPLVYTLHAMEEAGIHVDRQALTEYGDRLKAEIDELEQEIYALSGEEFNINSPQQLGNVLFGTLKIPGGKKTKTGYSTSAEVLQKIAGEHPVVDRILRYRMLTKLYGTYAAGLPDDIKGDGRIHCRFNQTVTATGRLSCTDPNLQNIPVRTPEGREIRRVFIPEEGRIFVDADYSQVELRILAALSGDEKLIAAYGREADIHTLTASQVFHVPESEVTPELRRNAKAVNFGIVYGISAFGLGEDLSISRKEAAEYIERYFETYPKVKAYLDATVAGAKEKGYTVTAFGRRRPIPELASSNFMQRSFGERAAMNAPIQGTAADIMKIAMNRVSLELEGRNMKGERTAEPYRSRLVLQVHDELLVEAVPEELEKVKELLRRCMEQAAELAVSLRVDIKEGYNWHECH